MRTALSTLVLAGPLAAQGAMFAPPQTLYEVPADQVALAVFAHDLDGDGHPELMVARALETLRGRVGIEVFPNLGSRTLPELGTPGWLQAGGSPAMWESG